MWNSYGWIVVAVNISYCYTSFRKCDELHNPRIEEIFCAFLSSSPSSFLCPHFLSLSLYFQVLSPSTTAHISKGTGKMKHSTMSFTASSVLGNKSLIEPSRIENKFISQLAFPFFSNLSRNSFEIHLLIAYFGNFQL